MSQIQELSNFLENKLNTISIDLGFSYKFKIMAENGAYKEPNIITGILKSSGNEILPIENFSNGVYSFVCEISIPVGSNNLNILNIEDILDALINENNSTQIPLSEGMGIITFNSHSPKDYKISGAVGSNVPLSFGIKLDYAENGVFSNNKKWLLNGEEIPYYSESLSLEKDGVTNVISNELYTKTLPLKQTKYYTFDIPYDASNSICKMLHSDLFNGNFDKTYTLTYYDNVVFTEQSPFTTTVSIFRNAKSNSTKPKLSMLNVTFTDADNVLGDIKYYMALVDFSFSQNSEDTRYFENQEAQKTYFEDKITNGAMYEQIKSPNLNSIFITNQVYKNTNNYDIFDLVNKNYAIIKVTKEENGIEQETARFYYYVTNASIGANGQILFDLKLDTIQTYLFNDNIQISKCNITRANLNRWVDNNDGTVSFNGNVDSPLFEREDIQNVSKRLIKRTNLYYQPDTTENSPLNKWLQDNVSGWVYIYLSQSSGTEGTANIYTSYKNDGTDQTQQGNITPPFYRFYSGGAIGSLQGICGILCYPIYKTAKTIRLFRQGNLNTTNYIELNDIAFRGFQELNKYNSYVISLKLDMLPPFDTKQFQTLESGTGQERYWIDENNNLCFTRNGNLAYGNQSTYGNADILGLKYAHTAIGNEDGYGLAIVRYINKEMLLNDYTISKELTFKKTDIINSNKDFKFNPKLLNADYCSLKLTNERGQGFEYDIQKLNKKVIKTKVSSPFTPDIKRSYFRITNLDGVYIDKCDENLTGFVDSVDNSLMVDNSYLAQVLAENKNFFLQQTISIFEPAVSGLIGGALAGGGNPLTSVAGAGLGIIKGAINNYLTIDNMRNKPNEIRNANGNIYFNRQYTENGEAIEEYDILDNEKEIINDYMVQYGFTYNRIGNIKDFLNTRKYFNFIQADIQAISGVSISNAVRDNIRERFSNGIRFWNTDSIDYSLENYEKWLEE